MPSRCLAYLLLICFLIPIFLKVGILSKYVIQYKYYIEVLCINKNKPELKCNGKCHLAKELKTVDEEPLKPELPIKYKDKTEDILFNQIIDNLNSFIMIYDIKSYSFYNSPLIKYCSKGKTFQPPELISYVYLLT